VTSFWWRSLGGLPAARPPLPGPTECDVAVVGGGYTGLWTALYLKRARPGWRVVVLEAEVCGYGASGRNGGWLSGLVAGDAGPEARRAMAETIDEVQRSGIDCDLVRGGALVVATSAPQLERMRALAAEEPGEWTALGREEVAARVRVAGALGALFTPDCARIHPAKLVRGLVALCEAEGVEIYERTRVFAVGARRTTTARGDVQASWVVRATEGYTRGLGGLRRVLVPLNSAMVVTEPLPAGAWAEIGWEGCETLRDEAHVYVYLQRTADGRIAIGGRGIPYRYGSRTDRAGEIAAATAAELRERLVALFPVLGDVRIDDGWAGVLGVSRDWSPSVGVDRATGIAWAGGYVGDGVSTANLFARILRDLICEEDSEIVGLPFVGHPWRRWEPEPLRWPAIRGVYRLYRAADRRETRTGRPSRLATVADAIARR
jgi:glycine/D-amino acid oxidase-like deaminating enzyme